MEINSYVRKRKDGIIYVAAIFFPFFSLAIQIGLEPITGNHKLLFFYPATFFIAWIGGTRPGYLCTLLSGLIANYALIEPRFQLIPSDLAGIIELITYIIIGFIFSYLIGKNYSRDSKVVMHARELNESREFLDSLLENIPLMVFVKDAKELRFIRFNKAGEELIGLKREDFIGKNDYDFFPKEQADFFIAKDREVLAGNKIVDIQEESIKTKLQGIRILHTKKIPLYGPSGKAEYLLGVSEDITERNKHEEEMRSIIKEQAALDEREIANTRETFLAEASTLLASSLDYHANLVLLANLSATVLGDWCTIAMINDDGEFERVSGAHSDPKMKAPLAELIQNYPPDKRIQSVQKISSFINPVILESDLVAMARDARHLELLKTLGFHSSMIVPIIVSGKYRGAISFISGDAKPPFNHLDLSLAEELARRAGIAIENSLLYASAQNAIKARDQFVSIASHELKTPITSLKMQLQMVLRAVDIETGEVPTAQKLKKTLDSSANQVDRLTKLIEDLLDVTRIEKGKLNYTFEEINLSELVREVVERFTEDFKRARCDLSLDIISGVQCFCDRYRIEQVITNLITNAIKYGAKHSVRISVFQEGTHAIFSVQDSGMGISKEKHAKIFERFERAISSTNISGLGLGLFISKQIIEAHQGIIEVDSDINQGATFKVSIPSGIEAPSL